MLIQPFILLSVLSIQAYANTDANTDANKLNQTDVTEVKVNQDGSLDPLVDTVTNEKDNLAQTQRQKRFNNYGFSGLPFNPGYPVYPSYVKRDDSEDSGIYGETNKLLEIRKRLQDIITASRQYLPPRPAIQPTFVPIFYVPSRCFCNQVTHAPPSSTNNKPKPTPLNPTTDNTESPPSVTPDFPTRMGIENEDINDNDGVRPISFKPIPSKKPLSRHSPPVEHGTVQAGAEPSQMDGLDSNQTPNRPEVTQFDDPATTLALSLCDKAVLKCCHQNRITFECFKAENCLEPPFNKRLCESDVLLNVFNKYIEVLKQKGV